MNLMQIVKLLSKVQLLLSHILRFLILISSLYLTMLLTFHLFYIDYLLSSLPRLLKKGEDYS